MAATTPICDFGWKAADFELEGIDFVIAKVIPNGLALLENTNLFRPFPAIPIGDVRFVGLFSLEVVGGRSSC